MLVHDLHPDYASTRYAIDRERQDSIPRLAVQHHHAHLASCLADNQVQGPAIGVILDGTGFGTDGTIWGGEFLVGDCREFRRAAHFRNVPMPGGERAIREPWRMAAAYLVDAGLDDRPLRHRVPSLALATVNRLIERKLNAPLTSSVGRLFDAIASMIGLRDRVSHEGQAAIELEWLATGAPNSGSYPFEIEEIGGDGAPLTIDVRLMFIQIVSEVDRGVQPAIIARRFHSTLVEIITEVCLRLRRQTGIDLVALSGGVFQNALLSVEVLNRLTEEGLQTLRHRRVPPGDGGLSLGQIAIAAAQDMRQSLAY